MTGEALAADLLESDRRYFELGAEREELGGASLAWMPGLASEAPGCVVHRVNGGLASAPEEWLEAVEERVRGVGAEHRRVYLDGPRPELESALRRRGLRPREEVGYLGPARRWREPAARVSLVPVETERDWGRKLEVHSGAATGPDGHAVAPARLVELERRKCESGEMRAYLGLLNGRPAAAVGALEVGSLLRIKNVFVRESHRRMGVATELLQLLAEQARTGGREKVGLFAVRGGAGDSLYRRVGMEPVLTQTEWMR